MIAHREAAQYKTLCNTATIVRNVNINAVILPGDNAKMISKIISAINTAKIVFLYPKMVIGTADMHPPVANPA